MLRPDSAARRSAKLGAPSCAPATGLDEGAAPRRLTHHDPIPIASP